MKIKTILTVWIFIISVFACPQCHGGKIRVVSLAPSITEALFAIGLDETDIIGITDYCNYPPQTRKILKVGSLTTTNIEKIISLEPDYVFSAGHDHDPFNIKLRKAGLNVVSLEPRDINEIFSDILKLGKVLHREKAAKDLVNGLTGRLNVIEAKARSINQRKKIYVEIWDDPITTCGKGSFVDEVITKAGGINIGGNIAMPYPTINQEFIIRENPDFIILGYMSKGHGNALNAISARFGWQGINAVKQGHIVSDIDPNTFLRPGPRIVEGVEEIYKRVYGNK